MTISLNERDRRYRSFKTLMEKEQLSILLVASNAMFTGHVRYFSNYATYFGPTYVVFPRDENPTLFVFGEIQSQLASRLWIKDSRYGSGRPDVVLKRIKELDYRNKRIGLVGVDHISFKMYEHLQRELPSATFIDVTQDVLKLRMIKSEEEQGLARQSASIADRLFARIKEVAAPGMRECDLYAEMEYFVRKQKVEDTFDLIASGPFPIAPSMNPSERMLEPDDNVLVELTPRYEGYYTQLTGVHSLSAASPQMQEFLDIVFAAQKAALAFLKPGNRACDGARAMKQVIEKSGYRMPYRGGHSLGHDLDEPPPAIILEDETVIKPGMIIIIHPSVMDKNGEGTFFGDSYIVTETGWERLNTAFSH